MQEPGATAANRAQLTVGTRVEVQTGFDGSWATGFAVEEVLDAAYRVRRRSDDEVLPAPIASDKVRRERKNSMWWY